MATKYKLYTPEEKDVIQQEYYDITDLAAKDTASLYSQELSYLGLDTRSYLALQYDDREFGMPKKRTIGDLIKMSFLEMRQTRNIGKLSIENIEQRLNAVSFKGTSVSLRNIDMMDAYVQDYKKMFLPSEDYPGQNDERDTYINEKVAKYFADNKEMLMTPINNSKSIASVDWNLREWNHPSFKEFCAKSGIELVAQLGAKSIETLASDYTAFSEKDGQEAKDLAVYVTGTLQGLQEEAGIIFDPKTAYGKEYDRMDHAAMNKAITDVSHYYGTSMRLSDLTSPKPGK